MPEAPAVPEAEDPSDVSKIIDSLKDIDVESPKKAEKTRRSTKPGVSKSARKPKPFTGRKKESIVALKPEGKVVSVGVTRCVCSAGAMDSTVCIGFSLKSGEELNR